MDNLTQIHLLYKQFVAWACNGRSTASLTNYINNPVYQELTDKGEHKSSKTNERACLRIV